MCNFINGESEKERIYSLCMSSSKNLESLRQDIVRLWFGSDNNYVFNT